MDKDLCHMHCDLLFSLVGEDKNKSHLSFPIETCPIISSLWLWTQTFIFLSLSCLCAEALPPLNYM
jgi:hypothetical protein